ncbi:MAG: hypothetical protein EOO61_09825 [Hymenobacter sp.]|nr:MAG: hypothetical protein EOO61_09825 [Hymenobacter sp.]
MTISEQACSYCEYSEGEDIEHVYPKSWFPDRTFSWDNYLLACKSCNTSFKSNGFAVFQPAGSTTLYHLTSQTPGQPPSTDSALLNPRAENPLDYLELDFLAGLAFVPVANLSQRDQQRADYTRGLLHLNTRAELRKARSTAHRHFFGLLREYVEVKQATTVQALDTAVIVPNVVDLNQPLARQRALIMVSLRRAIRTHAHPSVWYELKRQHPAMPKTNLLFQAAPEALSW